MGVKKNRGEDVRRTEVREEGPDSRVEKGLKELTWSALGTVVLDLIKTE